MSMIESSHFHYHRLRHELGNYALVRLRNCNGIIASMHQSGTHWLKFMLATAMADHYGIPGPEFNHANDIIGGPKDSIRYSNLPEIRASHTIPPLLVRNRFGVKLLNLPPSLILIRDIRARRGCRGSTRCRRVRGRPWRAASTRVRFRASESVPASAACRESAGSVR